MDATFVSACGVRANREEEEHGRFFQDRYKATRLADEASLLACAAYVDLNPIRAAISETLEDSEHTSVQRRLQSVVQESDKASAAEASDTQAADEIVPPVTATNPASFLSPLSIDESSDPIGPCESESGQRCSEKGFLAITTEDYLELLDWTARQVVAGKRGVTPTNLPPVLARLGLDAGCWCELVSDFGRLFCSVAGRPQCVDSMRCHRTQRRYHLRRRARELLTAGD